MKRLKTNLVAVAVILTVALTTGSAFAGSQFKLGMAGTFNSHRPRRMEFPLEVDAAFQSDPLHDIAQGVRHFAAPCNCTNRHLHPWLH